MKSTAPRNVLMVAYHYPPEGSSSGVLRTLQFTRHLPALGWNPQVLTLRRSVYPVRDETLEAAVPRAVTIHRVRGWDTSRHLAIHGRYLEWMAVPDPFVTWLPFGIARGLRVVRNEHMGAIFSTSPKPTAHLIAAALKARTGLPWVADFRDPWIDPGYHPRPGTVRLRVESRLEAHVVTRADRITVTTPELRDDLMRRYPDLPPSKFVVIYNGYDESDFDALGSLRAAPRFEVLHAGLVTPGYRDPVPFLRAVAGLIAAGDLMRAEIDVVFLGAGEYVESAAFRAIVRDLGLDDVVKVQARIPHRETLRRLQRAAVLLLLQGTDTQSQIPAKAFEYLPVGRPILALAIPGATTRLLDELGAGVVADPSSAEAIAPALRSVYRDWKSAPDRIVRVPGVARFSRAALTTELAAVLDDLVGPKIVTSPSHENDASHSR